MPYSNIIICTTFQVVYLRMGGIFITYKQEAAP